MVTTIQEEKRGRKLGFQLTPQHKRDAQIRKMLDLWVRGVNISDIARILRTNPQTIHARLASYRKTFIGLDILKDFPSRKAFVFQGLELQLLKLMVSPEKLSKANLREIAYAFEVICRAQRDIRKPRNDAFMDVRVP